MEKVHAWAPAHATIFFAVPDKTNWSENRLEQGSIGGGINFESGVISEIQEADKTTIFFNSQKIKGKITRTVLDLFYEKSDVSGEFMIHHDSRLPTGYGLSTSGAGAISLLYALRSFFQTEQTDLELLQIAHEAEIICKTGLGSVLGQSVPGIEIRLKKGAPGIGTVISIPSNEPIWIIPMNSLSTKQVITNEEKMNKVTKAGMEILENYEAISSVEDIIHVGRTFTDNCGLATSQVTNLLRDLSNIGEDLATMAMIGETVIVKPQHETKLESFLKHRELSFVKTSVAQSTAKQL